MKKSYVHRSARTGRFITAAQARRSPATSIKSKIPARRSR